MGAAVYISSVLSRLQRMVFTHGRASIRMSGCAPHHSLCSMSSGRVNSRQFVRSMGSLGVVASANVVAQRSVDIRHPIPRLYSVSNAAVEASPVHQDAGVLDNQEVPVISDPTPQRIYASVVHPESSSEASMPSSSSTGTTNSASASTSSTESTRSSEEERSSAISSLEQFHAMILPSEPSYTLPYKTPKKVRVAPTVIPPTSSGIPLNLELFKNGMLLVDKPIGWTSFDVCGKLRNTLKFLGIKKVGHAGTLDPLATGLLIVCTGEGTRFADDFQAMTKEYSGVFRLGEATDSYDAETPVSHTAPWEHISDESISEAANTFKGDILQIPPMFSAIKVKGVKLYDMAREGQSIERQPRAVNIDRFDVSRPAGPASQDVEFYVGCSKGTYIRSLAHDMGEALGSAAHLKGLRRTAIGKFRVDTGDAWTVTELIAALIEQREIRQAQYLAAQANEVAAVETEAQEDVVA